MIRIWRSWKSAFGEFSKVYEPEKDECYTALDTYTDEELQRIADADFNAVWIHAQINYLVKTEVFPELGEYADMFQDRLNALIQRAKRYGIKVYLYMQIPRGLPQEHILWKHHPECAGMPDTFPDTNGDCLVMLPMCTSVPKVREYLRAAVKELTSKIPEMAGMILITASEYVSHCYARGARVVEKDGELKPVPVDCPRCTKRTPVETVSEIIRTISAAVHETDPGMQVIVWNWSWTIYEESPCYGMLNSLPDDVILMADFERGGKRQLFGKEIIVNEYSLGYAGPSEQFQSVYASAKERKIRMIAKLQLGTTHELATVPNLPLTGNIRKKALRFAQLDLDGFMGCWNFGNMPSANTYAFHYFLNDPAKTLSDFASEYFPGSRKDLVVQAWETFEEAMEYYPFENNYLYYGPTNLSPALPFEPGPVSEIPAGRSWLPEPVRGDNISRAFKFRTVEEVTSSLERLTELWNKGTALLLEGLASASGPRVEEERTNVLACDHLLRGALHYVKAYEIKTRWNDDSMDEWKKIASSELENLQKLLTAAEQDPRIGYHIEAHAYLFTPEQIREKIRKLEKTLLSV